jgi:hypothetical protein
MQFLVTSSITSQSPDVPVKPHTTSIIENLTLADPNFEYIRTEYIRTYDDINCIRLDRRWSNPTHQPNRRTLNDWMRQGCGEDQRTRQFHAHKWKSATTAAAAAIHK